MSKKYLFGLLVLSLILASFVGLVYAKRGDLNVMGLGATITYPSGGYNYSVDYFSWIDSSSEITIHACFYELNSVFYTMPNCNPGIVNFSSILTDNNYLLKLWYNFSYDAEPGVSYSSVVDVNTFYIDTISPDITINFPTGAEYPTKINTINYTLFEANPDSCWYSINGSPNTIVSCSNGTNTILLTSNENWNTWQVCANDTVGHEDCDSVTFFVDSISPQIGYNDGTTLPGNYSQNWILINITCSDANKNSVVLNWNGINESFDNNAGDVYWAKKGNLTDGTYTFYAWCNDTVGHSSFTDTQTVTLDTVAPVITLNAPDNSKAFAQGSNITIEFNVTETNLKQCNLTLNGNTQAVTPTTKVLSGLTPGKYEWNITCEDYSGNSADSETRTFTVLSDLTFPPGTEYPDLTLEPDISSVWFYIKNEFGIINWTQQIDLSRGLNWAEYINLSFNHANVSTSDAYELNKPAAITLFNLTWANPQILKDGVLCSNCIMNSYENGTINFDVSGFSVYETREKPGSVSGSGGTSCKTNQWVCSSWSECLQGMQIRTCELEKPWCENKTVKPAEKQECIMPIIENKTTEITEQFNEISESKEKKPRLSGITGFITANMAPTALTIGVILAITLGYLIMNYRNKRLDAMIKEEISKQSGVKWVSKQEN